MASWRDLAATALAGKAESDEVMAPVERYGLPADLYADLARLKCMSPPSNLARESRWGDVVRDALRLARDGWAATALSLGWSKRDLFGVGPKDSHEFEGLAVWLVGRPIMLLDDRVCIVADGGNRSIFNRGGLGHGKDADSEPALLWDFGRPA